MRWRPLLGVSHITLGKWTGLRGQRIVDYCSPRIWDRFVHAVRPFTLGFNLALVSLETTLSPLAPEQSFIHSTHIPFRDCSLAHQYLEVLQELAVDHLRIEPAPRTRFHITIDQVWELRRVTDGTGLTPYAAVRGTFEWDR